jgi:hypothetical protein
MLGKDGKVDVVRGSLENSRFLTDKERDDYFPEYAYSALHNVKKDGIIVGYRETMYCYVLGQDGGDGYINMKFTFQRYKDVGKSYTNVKGVWPMLSRINIIPKSAFGELKDN